MKKILYAIVCLVYITSCGSSEKNQDEGPGLPNVILILSDDVGIGDIGCYGASLIQTPRIDQLAEEGMTFHSAYANGSVCSPTRYSVITGCYPYRTDWLKVGAVNKEDPLVVDTEKMSIAAMFKGAGYATAAIGKWHLGYGPVKPCDYNQPLKPGPLELGFEYHFGVPVNHNDNIRTYVENHELLGRTPGVAFEFADNTNDIPVKGISQERVDDEVETMLTEKALSFIRDNQGGPFFLYLTMCAAHTHVTPHERFRGTSEAGQYGDYMQELDYHVGEILDLLDELDLAERTIVVFASDNGGQRTDYKPNAGKGLNLASEAGDVRIKARTAKMDAYHMGHRTNLDLRGYKGMAYEGGFRIPFIVRWPGRTPEGSTSDVVVNTADLFRTFAQITTQEVPKDAAGDSYSFLPALLDPDSKDFQGMRDASVLQAANGTHALRQGDWKLIHFSRGDPDSEEKDELYNLREDPGETENLADKHPDQAEQMRTRLHAILSN